MCRQGKHTRPGLDLLGKGSLGQEDNPLHPMLRKEQTALISHAALPCQPVSRLCSLL